MSVAFKMQLGAGSAWGLYEGRANFKLSYFKQALDNSVAVN